MMARDVDDDQSFVSTQFHKAGTAFVFIGGHWWPEGSTHNPATLEERVDARQNRLEAAYRRALQLSRPGRL